MKRIAGVILALMMTLTTIAPAYSLGYDTSNYRKTMIQMLAAAHDVARGRGVNLGIYDAVAESGDPLYVAPLIDIAYFARSQDIAERVLGTLNALTGDLLGWQGFFEWAGANDIALPPHYDEFKGQLLAAFVDTEFSRFFEPGVMDSAAINLVEPVWGGVTVDGIPSLVNARQISPKEAVDEGYQFVDFCRDGDCSYPAADELVFGLSLEGDSRAYPLRLLNWHEMFNDVIGQAPLYDEPDGDIVCGFRAPTEFDARARSGEGWVLISGLSAGCPREGWLRQEHVQWLDNENALSSLPDIAAGEDALETGFAGRVPGRPVMLAYCTLCGAGVLYDVSIADLSYTDLDGSLVELGDTGPGIRFVRPADALQQADVRSQYRHGLECDHRRARLWSADDQRHRAGCAAGCGHRLGELAGGAS